MRIPLCLGLLAVVVASGAAQADMTVVGSSGETSTLAIVKQIYGNSITGDTWGGLSYSNGTITLTRVNDSGVGSPLHLTGSPASANDQYWADGVVDANVEAKFAGYSQTFGTDTLGKLFSVTGNGFNVTGSKSNVSLGTEFVWFRGGDGDTWYSAQDLNSDTMDHMLTYEVTGLGTKTWLLFWEDMSVTGDKDYNDLVVQVQVVPVPGAALLIGLGLSCVGWLKRRIA